MENQNPLIAPSSIPSSSIPQQSSPTPDNTAEIESLKQQIDAKKGELKDLQKQYNALVPFYQKYYFGGKTKKTKSPRIPKKSKSKSKRRSASASA
jgi:hypothetical protein